MSHSLTEQEFTYDSLIVADFPIVTENATIITGQNLSRGCPLGKITASGKLTQLDSSASDGSQNPYAILVDDTDASAADKTAAVYLSGAFNENVVDDYLVTGDTIADFKDSFRAIGIYIKAAHQA